MAGFSRRRGVVVTALALASGTSLASLATAAPAGAQRAGAPAYYHGVTSANVLGVALNLPKALPALPGVPKDLAVNLIGVRGNAVHNTTGVGLRPTSTAEAGLANGSLVTALPAQLGLDKTVKATLTSRHQASTSFSVPSNPLVSLNVGQLAADVVGAASGNTATAVLADGNVAKLSQLLDISVAGASSSTLLSTVEGTLKQADVTGQAQAALDQLQQALQPVVSQDPTGQAAQLEAAVNTIVKQINSIVANVGDSAVVKIKTLDARQSIKPGAGDATSMASVNLADVNVLGLVDVKGFVSQATATASGKPGGASASFSGHKPIVTVGTPLLSATLDETGLNLDETLQSLPPQAQDAVHTAIQTLQNAINGVIKGVGVNLKFVQGRRLGVKPDGSYAAAVGPEYLITLKNPAAPSEALVAIGLGHNTVASMAARQATVHHVIANPQSSDLPHTGANLPLLAGGGLALLVGAAVLRRRIA